MNNVLFKWLFCNSLNSEWPFWDSTYQLMVSSAVFSIMNIYVCWDHVGVSDLPSRCMSYILFRYVWYMEYDEIWLILVLSLLFVCLHEMWLFNPIQTTYPTNVSSTTLYFFFFFSLFNLFYFFTWLNYKYIFIINKIFYFKHFKNNNFQF